jgi:hypothetical protein
MVRIGFTAFSVLLLLSQVALANAGPPSSLTTPNAVSPAAAAVAGSAGAVLLGIWLTRRPKP